MIIRCLLFLFAALLLPAVSHAAIAAEPRAAFEQAIEEAKAEMMADPQDALAKGDIALARAAALPPAEVGRAQATALWLKAEANLYLNRFDDAAALLVEALALARQYARNTKLQGDLLRARGAVEASRGQLQPALRSYLAAYRIFRVAGERRSQAIMLQDLGLVYLDAGDYERSLRYYAQALELHGEDPYFALTMRNNTGEVLKLLGREEEAEREYLSALTHARTIRSPMLETRILTNLALVQADLGKLEPAERNAQMALRLSRGAEGADWQPFVYGALAKVAALRGNHQRAAELLERLFAGVDLNKTELVFREFHQIGFDIYKQLGRPEAALAHLQAYQRLDSEARDLIASASSQLLTAQFDFTNQNLRIAQLKQGQLERDVKMERQRVTFRTTLFTGLAIAGAIVLALMTFAFLSIRRSRNKVHAANEVLTGVNAELEKALKAKTDFLAMTSHEIRTPLNGILGMTQVMLANARLCGEEREQVQLVHGAGQAMRALVDDILDVAKMETGQVSVELAPTYLRPVLEDAIALWRGQAVAKGLVLEAELEAAPDLVETDGGKVRQIVFNLLSNAIKFTPAGQVRLVAGCDRAEGTLWLSVEDSGIGIPEEQQAKIFEAFHQVDSAMTRQFSGTGLGLAICRNLAVALGGTIALASEPGRGSRFTVTLPLREVAATPAAARPLSLGDARMGVVEANEMKRGMIRGLIGPHIAAALDASNAQDALNLLAAGAVDHLLLDAASLGEEKIPALSAIISRAREQGVLTSVLLAPEGAPTLEDVSALEPTVILLKPIKGAELLRSLRGAYSEREPSALKRVA